MHSSPSNVHWRRTAYATTCVCNDMSLDVVSVYVSFCLFNALLCNLLSAKQIMCVVFFYITKSIIIFLNYYNHNKHFILGSRLYLAPWFLYSIYILNKLLWKMVSIVHSNKKNQDLSITMLPRPNFFPRWKSFLDDLTTFLIFSNLIIWRLRVMYDLDEMLHWR